MSDISTHPYAGLLPRGVAYVTDCALAFVFFAVSQVFILQPARSALGITDAWFQSGVNTELYTLLTISIPIWLYFALFESSARQATPGKRLMKLKVFDAAGLERIGFSKAVLRTLVKLLPWEIAHLTNNLPVPTWYADESGFRVGFIAVGLLMGLYMAMVALTAKKQGLHDLTAGTVVLK